MPALVVRGVSKFFGNVQAVLDVSFDVASGEVLALLGPSGCGKSTVLAMVAGLERPDGGEIAWEGRSLAAVAPHQRGFGLMFQDFALFPHLNVFENVAFGLRMLGWTEERLRARVAEMLALVGLPGFARRDVNTLSGGEQQRIALARSLAPAPRLLMLDEPLGSLDRALRERLVSDLGQILRDMRQTAIYVTHDQEEAFALADRVVVMNAGRLEQVGTPQAIYSQPASPFVARFLGMANLLDGTIAVHDGLKVLHTTLGEFKVDSPLNGQVTMLLRPDAARLDGSGDLHLDGRLSKCSFRGGFCRASVDVKGVALVFDFPLSANLPDNGETLRLSFDADQALQIFAPESDQVKQSGLTFL